MSARGSALRLSMVMIARDERANVRPCFGSFWEHVDEVVLCDTGSSDDTIAEARKFALERGDSGKLIVGQFEWCDDFGAARTHAHSLAAGDVHVTIDLDDRLIGGEHLREAAGRLLVEQACERGLALTPDTEPESRASLCELRARARYASRDLAEAASWAREAIRLHPPVLTVQDPDRAGVELDSNTIVYRAWMLLARCAIARRAYRDAADCAAQAASCALREDHVAAARDLAAPAVAQLVIKGHASPATLSLVLGADVP